MSATAAPAAVATRRHWYGVGKTRCAYQVMPRNIAVYAAAAATAEPIIPWSGTSRRLSATLTSAAAPVITQLNCVRLARPTPIAITMYAA